MADQERDVDVSRRDLGSLLGALAGGVGLAALAGCANEAQGGSPEHLARVAQALSGAGSLQYADTASELRALTGGSVGWIAILNGYNARGDGGGGVFYWNSTAAQDDGGTVLNSGSGNSAGWRRIYSGTVNAKWFGAGLGGTNDSSAIANALSVAGAGTLYFPNAVYSIGATVVVSTQGAQLVGDGRESIFRATGTGYDLLKIRSHYIRIKGLAFEGAATSSTSPPQYGVNTDTSAQPNNGTIDDCFFGGAGSPPTAGVNNGLKLNVGCNYWVVRNNSFVLMQGYLSGYGYAMEVAGCYNDLYSNNVVGSTSAQNGRHGVYLTAGATANRVHHNYIERVNSSGINCHSELAGPPVAYCQYNEISNNTVISRASIANSDDGGIQVGWYARYNRVSDNIIENDGGIGIVVCSYQTSDTGCVGNQIVDNRIHGSVLPGIYVCAVSRTVVSGNVVLDCASSGFGAIEVAGYSPRSGASGVADRNVILGNVCMASTGTPGYGGAVWVDNTSPGVSNTVVKGNILMQGSHGDVWLPTPSATLSETESTVTNAHDNWDV